MNFWKNHTTYFNIFYFFLKITMWQRKIINVYLWEHWEIPPFWASCVILFPLLRLLGLIQVAARETVTMPKLKSHRWYPNMSISQLSISYLQEVSTARQERVSKHKEDCIIILVKLVVEVMAPFATNLPHFVVITIKGWHLDKR